MVEDINIPLEDSMRNTALHVVCTLFEVSDDPETVVQSINWLLDHGAIPFEKNFVKAPGYLVYKDNCLDTLLRDTNIPNDLYIRIKTLICEKTLDKMRNFRSEVLKKQRSMHFSSSTITQTAHNASDFSETQLENLALYPASSMLEASDPHRESVLHIVCRHHYINATALLLVTPEIRTELFNRNNREGLNPLHICAMQANSAGLILLLHCGARINESAHTTGNTALHIAVYNNFSAGVHALLRHPGIDINMINREGKTALDIATENGYIGIREALLNFQTSQQS